MATLVVLPEVCPLSGPKVVGELSPPCGRQYPPKGVRSCPTNHGTLARPTPRLTPPTLCRRTCAALDRVNCHKQHPIRSPAAGEFSARTAHRLQSAVSFPSRRFESRAHRSLHVGRESNSPLVNETYGAGHAAIHARRPRATKVGLPKVRNETHIRPSDRMMFWKQTAVECRKCLVPVQLLDTEEKGETGLAEDVGGGERQPSP